MGAPTFNFATKLWQRSQNSYATTIPQPILALKEAPTENGKVKWWIKEETGEVVVSFQERSESDGDENE